MTHRKKRVVLDSNVLISALVFRGKPWDVAAAGFLGKCQLVTSHFIGEEVVRGLIKLGHSPAEAEVLIAAYESVAELVYLDEIEPLSRDSDDDSILATAKEGGADYIITGDKDLLVLGCVGCVKIVTPADFLAIE